MVGIDLAELLLSLTQSTESLGLIVPSWGLRIRVENLGIWISALSLLGLDLNGPQKAEVPPWGALLLSGLRL